MCVKSLQLCATLCDPMDCSPPGSPVHGILQARKRSPPGDLSEPGIEPVSLMSPALAGGFFISSATWKVENMKQIRRKLSLLSSASS